MIDLQRFRGFLVLNYVLDTDVKNCWFRGKVDAGSNPARLTCKTDQQRSNETMEKSTAIIDAQTSLLRELRETYVAIAARRVEKKCVLRAGGSSNELAAATAMTMAAILRSIENLALATTLPVAPSVIETQQREPPDAEICKLTHDVVRIRNERNGRPGWENHAAEVCGISPERAIEVWDAVIAEAYAKPRFAEAKR